MHEPPRKAYRVIDIPLVLAIESLIIESVSVNKVHLLQYKMTPLFDE